MATPAERLDRLHQHLRTVNMGGNHPLMVVAPREDLEWLVALGRLAMDRRDDIDFAIQSGLIENVRDGRIDLHLAADGSPGLRLTDTGHAAARRLLNIDDTTPPEEVERRVRELLQGS